MKHEINDNISEFNDDPLNSIKTNNNPPSIETTKIISEILNETINNITHFTKNTANSIQEWLFNWFPIQPESH